MKRLALTLLFAACGVESPMDPGTGVDPASVPADAPPPPEREATGLTGFPCDVREVLQRDCAGCHVGQTYAPMLSSREDFLSPWPVDGITRTRGENAAKLINAVT